MDPAPRKPKTILVVDDDDLHNEVLEMAFSREGFQVRCAQDGKDALDKVAAAKPDLITMDIVMPVMNGYEAIRALNANGFGAIPVIVITAHQSYTPLQEEGLSLAEPNVREIIRKPVVLNKLIERVREILRAEPAGNGRPQG